jgi:hypothetical protein
MLAADHTPSLWFTIIFCGRDSSGNVLFCQLLCSVAIAYDTSI